MISKLGQDPHTPTHHPARGIPFLSLLATLNPCFADSHVFFFPGMRFEEKEKWWGQGGTRPTAHEGIDICFLKTKGGKGLRCSPETRIPMPTDGTVVHTIKDYLATTMIIAHNVPGNHPKGKLHTLLAHVDPDPAITRGLQLKTGVPIASVGAYSIGRRPQPPMPPHLHISMAWIQTHLSVQALDWPILWTTPGVTLIDPLTLMDISWENGPYQPSPDPYQAFLYPEDTSAG